MLSDDVRAALFARSDLGAKQEGERVHFRCPRHKDRTPSAWLGGGAWGCFACGFQESITTLADELGVPKANGNGTATDFIEGEYDYVDERGKLLYQVVRKYPKKFVQRRPDQRGGWDWSTKGVRRVLYRLPEVLRAVEAGTVVYVVEGEKHVDRLRQGNLVATTNSGGAGKWEDSYSDALQGANVVILPDNDEPGQKHAADILRSLTGKAADVRVVNLPDLPPKGDVLDWLAAGHSTDELDELAWDTKPRSDAGGFPAPLSVLQLLDEPEPEDVFLVEPFLPSDANVLLAAYPKCFKTGFLLSMSIAAAAGQPFLGMFPSPRQHRVGLVLMEDRAHRIKRRMRRLCDGVNQDLAALEGYLWHWFRPPLVLSEPGVVASLGRQAAELGLDLLIVDSWSYVSTGNPNDADIVTPQLVALSKLRDHAPGLTVILVHHARKAQPGAAQHEERFTDVIRNSSAFGAWYDAGIMLERQNEAAPVKVRMELRDLPAPDSFTFTLQDQFPAGPNHGLRPEGWLRIVPSTEPPAIAIQRAAGERLAPMVLEALRANLDAGLTKRELRARVPARAADVDAAFEWLRSQGRVRYDDPGKRGKTVRCYAVSTGFS